MSREGTLRQLQRSSPKRNAIFKQTLIIGSLIPQNITTLPYTGSVTLIY